MASFHYRPDITFEDTNLVGNVYFSNLVRWQNECRNEWLKATALDQYEQVFQGIQRFLVMEDSLRFLDPVGASLGDVVDVDMTVTPEADGSSLAVYEIRRQPVSGSTGTAALLATGEQRFMVTGMDDVKQPFAACAEAGQGGNPAYLLEFAIPLDVCRRSRRIEVLDLIRWQGKCREKFLTEYAPATLQSVIDGSLVLHTSQVKFQLLSDVQIAASDWLRIEMQLTHLKGGRLTMRFDYFVCGNQPDRPLRSQIASGEQSLCSKHVTSHGMAPVVFPCDMLHGLREFAGTEQLRLNISEALDFAEVDAGNQSDQSFQNHHGLIHEVAHTK